MKYVLILLLLLVPAATLAATIEHIGTTNPADEGWRVFSGVPGQPDFDGEPNWRIQIAGGSGRWSPVELGEEHFTGEWAYSVRSKWNVGGTGDQRATVFDGLRSKSTAFTWSSEGTHYYRPDTGDTLIPNSTPDGLFHTATVVMDPDRGDSMVFMYDGVIVDIVPSDEQNDTDGRYLLYWGDGEGSLTRPSDQQYSYVYFGNEVIPEPTTWAMLLVGGLCFFLCRRRRRTV